MRVDRDQLMVAPERRARNGQRGLERGRRLVISPLVAQNPGQAVQRHGDERVALAQCFAMSVHGLAKK